MDDNGRENRGRNLDTNDNTDSEVLMQKTDPLQSILPANCVPNGHYKRARLSLGPTSQQPSARAVLEPIPLAKLSRSKRLSSEAVLQLADACSKSDSKETLSNNDEIITKMFSNSCMEALTVLKRAYDEKLVSVVMLQIKISIISPHKVHKY